MSQNWPYCDVTIVGDKVKPGDEWPKRSAEGTVYWPSPSRFEKGTQADFDNAKLHFEERTEGEWVALFDRAPHILHQILGDIFRETRAETEREAGRARIGRRPKAVDGNIDELMDMITPRYSMEPFGESVQELIARAPSLRAFAKRAGITHHTITRMMRGDVALEMWRLEAIAKAGKVHPAFFKEYREQSILRAITTYLDAKPNLSIRVHKEIQRARRQG